MHHVPVADDGGLERPSWAMSEALRAVSLERFGILVGTASAGTLLSLTEQLLLWLAPIAHP